MPAPTPRMTLAIMGGLALDLLDLQHTLAGLAERDRQRLLLHPGLHQRADVLKQALAELRVVGVDLPRPLGRQDHQPVLAVDDAKQLVDRRVDDAVCALGGCHVSTSSLIIWVNNQRYHLPANLI